MKTNKIKIYAKALTEAIAKKGADEKKIIDNFTKLLFVAGLEKKAKEILDLAEDLLLKKQGKRKIIFETARRLTLENHTLLKKIVKEGNIIKEKINPELVAGVKITIDNEKQFDNSMLSKLNQLL